MEQARALHQQGQLEAALGLYDEIIAAHPDDAEAHYRRANVLKDQGALEAAVAGRRQRGFFPGALWPSRLAPGA